MIRRFTAFAALVFAFATTSALAAEAWPSRPIRLVLSQGAGGAPDIIARLLAQRLSVALGQQVAVENRAGGANLIGVQAVQRAAPDGYTLYFATAAAFGTNPHTFKSLPYDPVKDFTHVAMVGKAPFLVLAHPSVPAKTVGELAAYERANPGKLAFATDGPRNFSGLVAAWLNRVMSANIPNVPYTAMTQGIQDTIAGRTQLVILLNATAGPMVKRGDVKALAQTSAKRMPGFEDVPAVAETYPGFDFVGWFTIAAPAGTPDEPVLRLNRELDRILKDPEIVARLRDLSVYTEGADTPQGTRAFVASEIERYGQIVKTIGIAPE